MERVQDPCPLHGAALVPECTWCQLARELDLDTALQVLRMHLQLLLDEEQLGRRLMRLVVGGVVHDAVAVTAAIDPDDGRPPRLHRLLLKPDGVLELE